MAEKFRGERALMRVFIGESDRSVAGALHRREHHLGGFGLVAEDDQD